MLLNDTHQPENASFSCYHPAVEGYRYIAVLWGCAVTVVGSVGNLMTVLAFALDARLRTRFNVLIINLAMADLLYCTILQPISVDSYLYLRWRGGQLWCQTFSLLLFVSNSVSIITLCLIAASRYLLVKKRAMFDPLFSNMGLVLLLASTWALGTASFAPLWPVYVFVPQVCTCSFHRTRGRPYTTILLFFYFFAGLACVGVFYLLIYKRVQVAAKALVRYRFSRRSSKRRKAASSIQGTEENGLGSAAANTHSCELSSQGELEQNKDGITWSKSLGETQSPDSTPGSDQTSHTSGMGKSAPPSAAPALAAGPSASKTPGSGDDGEFKRVTRMCFTVFLSFVFCFAPFLLLNIADKNNRAPQVLHMFCANLTWLNSCINPVLYAAMNRQFRQGYHSLLTRATRPLAFLWRCGGVFP